MCHVMKNVQHCQDDAARMNGGKYVKRRGGTCAVAAAVPPPMVNYYNADPIR